MNLVRRNIIRHRFAATLLLGAAACLMRPAAAQTFFTTDQTIAGGNPINGNFTSIVIGADSSYTAFPNIHADITGGTITDYVNAIYQSVVNVSGGTIGTVPGGGFTSESLHIAHWAVRST